MNLANGVNVAGSGEGFSAAMPDVHDAILKDARTHERNGDFRRAEEIYRRILSQSANHPKALRGLGVIAHRAGKNDDATDLLQKAVSFDPLYAEAYNDLGGVLGAMGRTKEAIAAFERTVELRPDFAEAYGNLGIALSRIGKDADALEKQKRAAELRPQAGSMKVGLAVAYLKLGKQVEAVAELRQAVNLGPNHAEAHARLGGTLRGLGRFEEARAALNAAIRLRPNAPEPHVNLGLVYLEQNRSEEAVASLRTALRIKPDYTEAHWNIGLALLLQGNFVQGWPEYEWRRPMRKETAVRRDAPQPLWDGSDLGGRTLLLHTEQGLGDVLQFARYAAVAKAKGAGRVVLLVPPPLQRLLATVPAVDACVARGETMPAFDVHAPVMTLPSILGTTLETVPNQIPYVTPDPGKVAEWERTLGPRDGRLRVGLVWGGNPKHQNDRNRSAGLSAFAPLSRVRGAKFYSLQKGEPAKELDGPEAKATGLEIVDLTGGLSDFMETAAFVANLDLVISVDTSVVHLAGAMGKEVWSLLPFVPDWRWLLERDDTPWYPTMRLWRQSTRGDWPELLQRVARELGQRAGGIESSCSQVSIAVSPGELLDRLCAVEVSGRRDEAHPLRQTWERLVGDQSMEITESLRESEASIAAAQVQLLGAKETICGCEQRSDFGEVFIRAARDSLAAEQAIQKHRLSVESLFR